MLLTAGKHHASRTDTFFVCTGVVRTRGALEEILEREWAEGKGGGEQWLGHVVEGVWQIRSTHLADAVQAVVDSLVKDGHVIEVDVTGGGSGIGADGSDAPAAKKPKPRGKKAAAAAAVAKRVDGYVIANVYTLGEAFAARKARDDAAASTADDMQEDEEEEVRHAFFLCTSCLRAFPMRKNAEAGVRMCRVAQEEEPELSAYELERQQNILRNQAFLASLGLG